MASSSVDKEHYCEQCNLRVTGTMAWQQHLESKGHRRNESRVDQFNLNGEDMFIDDESNTMKLLSKFRIMLIGVEHIVEDRTNDEIKCMLCRVILKTTTLGDHLKSYGHQKLYLERLYPQTYRTIQLKAHKKGDVAYLIAKECEELVRQYGRQKIRVYEKGYAEKHQKMIEEQRETDIATESKKNCFPSSSANADEFDELPKNDRVAQVLLNSKLESFPKGESAYVNDVLKYIAGPVIGLEFVAEYTDPNGEFEPGYLCTTCESCLNSSQLVNHVVNDKHRLKYMERNYKNYHKIVTFSTFTDDRRKELLTKYSRDIELTHGRGEVTLRLVVPPNSNFLFRYHKRIRGNETDSPNEINNDGVACNDPYGPWPERPPSANSNVSNQHQNVILQAQTKQFVSIQPSKFVPIPPASAFIPSSSGSYVSPLSYLTHLPPLSQSPPTLVSPQMVSHLTPSTTTMPVHQLQFQTVLVNELPPGYSSAPSFASHHVVPRVAAIVQPRKPTFIYSEKQETARKMIEIEKSLPPWMEKSLESGWYSERAFSVDYFFQRVAILNLDYLSIRCPQARSNMYDDWSPYLMRRLQDQFNFELDHLAWLQDQVIRWRMPLYQSLQPTDLRPLEEEVEKAVLEILTYRTLKPFNIGKNRPVTEYVTKDEREVKNEKEIEIFDYEHSSDEPVPKKIKICRVSKCERSETRTPQPSQTREEGSSERDVDQRPTAETVMLTICDQILHTATTSGTNNAVLHLLLEFKNANTILYSLATREPKRLQQLVAYVKNPDSEISNETLNEYKKVFKDFS